MNQTSYVYFAIVGVFTGQQILAALLSPLSREAGLSALQVGVVLTASSAAVIVASPFWGRQIGKWGIRKVLVGSIAGAAAALLGFAVVAHLAVRGVTTTVLTFGLFLVFRSFLFGVTGGATPIAAQAHVVSVTSDQQARVRAFAMIGASFGIAGVIGPALGGFLASYGLLTALYVPPFLLAGAAVLLHFKLDSGRLAGVTEKVRGPRINPLDRRLWPFLVVGFTLFATLSFQTVLLGFVLQDRLGLSSEATAGQTGIAFLASGITSLATQLLAVRRLAWPPGRLLRCGLPLSLAGFSLLVVASSTVAVVAAIAVIGVGHAFAIPGYSAAPTLLVHDDEQAGVAAITSATNGVASIVGPTAATALYGLGTPVPFAVCAGLLIAALGFALFHPTVRRVGTEAATR